MQRRLPKTPHRERGRGALWAAVFVLCFVSGLAGGVAVRAVVGRPATNGSGEEEASKREGRRPRPVGKRGAAEGSSTGKRSAPSGPPEETPGLRASADRARAEEVFQRGLQAFSAGRYGDALDLFGRAAELDPTDYRPHHGMGKVYTELSLPNRAEESFRRAVEIEPRFVEAERELVKLLYDAGRHEEAVSILRRLEKKNPDDPFVWAELGLNALRTGDPHRAIELLERYRAATDDDAWANANLGRAYEEAGARPRAEDAYREAISENPYLAIAHYWLGQLLVAEGRHEEAERPLETYRRLREIETGSHQLKMRLLRDPEDVPAIINLALAKLRLGKPEEALRLLQRARRIAPNDQRLAELHAKVSAEIARRRSRE